MRRRFIWASARVPRSLLGGGFDEVILATGIRPHPNIPGIKHPKVMSYLSMSCGITKPVGEVAVIGAGGIGSMWAESGEEERSGC